MQCNAISIQSIFLRSSPSRVIRQLQFGVPGRKLSQVASRASSVMADRTQSKGGGTSPLGRCCIDVICHPRLEHINALARASALETDRQTDCQGFNTAAPLRCRTDCSALLLTITPIFSSIRCSQTHVHNPIYSVHSLVSSGATHSRKGGKVVTN